MASPDVELARAELARLQAVEQAAWRVAMAVASGDGASGTAAFVALRRALGL